MRRSWRNEAAALWLSPLAATLPLLPFVSLPSSPFYLGKLMDDPAHPFNWPHLGPLLSAMAAFVNAGLLGIVTVLFFVAPIYAALREYGKATAVNILVVCTVAGIVASQVARLAARGFRQADLRAFANSEFSVMLGCLCGFSAGVFIVSFANRRVARPLICCAPVAALGICAVLQMCLAGAGRGH